jgi:putative flavoprotein involved in K+ transport
MAVERVEVLVVGAGQAGIAMSEHLGRPGVPHLVLERARIAERWRSERWDSLVANGPAWHDRFPGWRSRATPDAFPGKEAVADYFVAYAERIAAPIRCGVEVTSVARLPGRAGFRVETSQGRSRRVRGGRDRAVPAAADARSRALRGPGSRRCTRPPIATPARCRPVRCWWWGPGRRGADRGGTGGGGAAVYLSVGPHGRPPRRYRGRDFVWWLGVLGKWDIEATPGVEHVTIAVSGAQGGTRSISAAGCGGRVAARQGRGV